MGPIFGYIGEVMSGVWLAGSDEHTYVTNSRSMVRVFTSPLSVQETATKMVPPRAVKVIPLVMGTAVE